MTDLTLAFALFVSLVSGALADSNQIYLLQLKTDSGESNTIYVDQSGAQETLIHGPSEAAQTAVLHGITQLRSSPALQYGTGNSAEVTLRGRGTELQLIQRGLPIAGAARPGHDNSAVVQTFGNDQLAFLFQNGDGNHATLTLRPGEGAMASLQQNGDLNRGAVTVQGTGTQGTMIQTGSNIHSALSVRARGAAVTYQVIGNNIAAPGGVSVSTNIGPGAPISIRQAR